MQRIDADGVVEAPDPTVLGGWYNIMDSIRDGYAFQATTGSIIGEIQIALNSLK